MDPPNKQIHETNYLELLVPCASADEALRSVDLDAKRKLWQFQYTSRLKVVSSSGEKLRTVRQLEGAVTKLEQSSYVCVPDYIHKFIGLAQQNPDRYGDESWCHAGGSLQSLNFQRTPVLLYVTGRQRENLCAVYLHPSCDRINRNNVGEVVGKEGKEIFQVSNVKCSGRVVVGARQKYSCSLHVLEDEDGSLAFSECFKCQSYSPISSYDISPRSNVICTIDYEKKIKLWEFSKGNSPVVQCDGPKCDDSDNWSSVHFGTDSDSVIYLTDRISVNLYDIQQKKTHVQQLWEASNEQIFLCFPSKIDPFNIFLATSHRLLMIDTRSPSSTVKGWLHSMPSPPLYSSVVQLGQSKKEEVVCIGNARGNVCLVSVSGSKGSLEEMPTLMDSLSICQSRGLIEEASLKYRVSHNIVGLTCIRETKSNDFKVLTQNSVSDIFSQSVLSERQLNDFDTHTREVTPRSDNLKASERWNLEHVFESLNDHWQQSGSNRKLESQKWNVSEHVISTYKDALGSVLVDAWGCDDIQPRAKNPRSEDKVMDWLQSVNSKVSSDEDDSD